ncbi:hypothetical protein TrLO_g2996 [Triparma laevis f. longispina]|uniref:Uncharacterized protein n=1 Tax=Triparma laevis f. longispina TaxID=1714387 RepID=A0A9W7C719_9STRA|nr:hypothetical protein TrLO_g2996 [Triparma laevis f. longispina]
MTSSSLPPAPPRHAWSSATTDNPNSSTLTTVEDPITGGGNVNTYLTMPVEECERMIEGLKEFKVVEVGSSVYLNQFNNLQTLNLTAHQHAQSHTDEYILEALSTFTALPKLLHNLLTLETYRTRVLTPLLTEHSNLPNKSGMRMYFTLYSEGVTLNLLELLFFHKHVISENLPHILDAVDYCVRQLRCLAVPVKSSRMMEFIKKEYKPGEEGNRIMERSKTEELQEHQHTIQYTLGLSSLTILRYLLESFPALPLNVQSRLLKTHDILLMIIPLIEEPPWIRRKNGGWEVWEEGKWEARTGVELNKLGKCGAQCWLCVFYLTGTKECRESYPLNEFRKGQILRLRKYLTDGLIDQLPVLADVRRYFDELALLSVPNHPSEREMTEIAPLKDQIERSYSPDTLESHYNTVWKNVEDRNDPDLKMLTDVYTQEGVESVLGEPKPFKLNGLPVEKVIVSWEAGSVEFEIKKKEIPKGVESETERGIFKRYKMTQKTNSIQIPPAAVDLPLTATLTFVSEIGHTCTVSSPLNFPSDKQKHWHQIGSVEVECVVQVGLEKQPGGEWIVNKGFVSLPVNEEEE